MLIIVVLRGASRTNFDHRWTFLFYLRLLWLLDIFLIHLGQQLPLIIAESRLVEVQVFGSLLDEIPSLFLLSFLHYEIVGQLVNLGCLFYFFKISLFFLLPVLG